MAPALETNVAALERELIIYEKGIPELLEVDAPFWSMIEKLDVDPASNRSTRIPLLNAIKGNFQQADMDNADLGGTSGPDWIVATLTPIYFTHGMGISAKAVYAATGERGVKNPWQELVRLASRQFRSALDMLAETAGNGVLGTITSVATDVFTLTTDGFKEELFYIGMPVQVFNAALTTDRGSTSIIAIDRENHTVTVAAAPGGTIATDLLLIEGLAATVTIQSSLFGKQYHQSDAATGLWMNLNRATYSNIRTPSVNAASSALTTAFIRRARNKIREYVGDEALAGGDAKLIASMHPCQADAYEALAITISQIIKQPTANQGVDQLFNNEMGMTMAGIPVKQSIHADRKRIDFLCLKYWQRIQATDTGYYRPPGSDQFVFPTINSGGDGLKSSSFFYLKTGLQLVNRHPLAGAYIKALAVPTNY